MPLAMGYRRCAMDDARLMKDIEALRRAQTISQNLTLAIPLGLAVIGALLLLVVLGAAFVTSAVATGILAAFIVVMAVVAKVTGAGEGVLAGAVAFIAIVVGIFSIIAAAYHFFA